MPVQAEQDQLLDELRARLVRDLSLQWHFRNEDLHYRKILQFTAADSARSRARRRPRLRQTLATIRALDGLRADHRLAERMREFWMLRSIGYSELDAHRQVQAWEADRKAAAQPGDGERGRG